MNTTAWSREHVEPRVRLHVQMEVAEPVVGDGAQPLAAHGLAARGVGLPGAVERGVGDHETGGPVVELAHPVHREALADARCLESLGGLLEAVPDLAQPRRDVLGGVAVQREVGAEQLGVAVAVVALAVVLHDELPVALLDEVDLVRDLRPPQRVGRQVGLDARRDVVEVGRGLVGEADEHEAADVADVDRLEPEAAAVERGRLVVRVQQPPVDVVGPVVVRAHEVADAAAGVVEDPRPAVPADVVEGAHLLVVVADDDHRGRADLHGDEVTGFGQLRLCGHEQPVLRPDGRHVQVEDLLARVEGRFQAVPGSAAADQGRQVVVQASVAG